MPLRAGVPLSLYYPYCSFYRCPLLLRKKLPPQALPQTNPGQSPAATPPTLTIRRSRRSIATTSSILPSPGASTRDEKGGLQTSPIIVGGVLYGITPSQKIFALNAATGKPLWTFDSGIVGTQPERGLVFWSSDGSENGTEKRILVGVMNFLYALDAATGKPIPSFGTDGRIDLREGLGRDRSLRQWISLTSPGDHLQRSDHRRRPQRRKRFPRRQAIFAPSMSAPANCAGRSTPFRAPANSATTPGRRTRGNTSAPPTTGAA